MLYNNPRYSNVSLPRKGTKLMRCLVVLSEFGTARSGEIAEVLNGTNSDIASQLTVLQAKGLVQRISNDKGKAGGSVWELTIEAKRLMGV